MTTVLTPPAQVDDEVRRAVALPGGGDRLFRLVLRAAGSAVLFVMAVVGLYLAVNASRALGTAKWSFLSPVNWASDSHHFGIAAVLPGTILIALVAICLAVPLATAMVLYITEYAPERFRRTLVSLVDLMAAVPSVVYGLWGFWFLQGHVTGLSRWLATYLTKPEPRRISADETEHLPERAHAVIRNAVDEY
jgi:phosphate transport system permease protein